MISRFLKARASDEKASVITYAFFHAFKFPDALSVHIKCKVEICRHGCLDHCQQNELPGQGIDLLERKDTIVDDIHRRNELEEDDRLNVEHDSFYDDIIHTDNEVNPFKKSLHPGPPKTKNNYHQYETQETDILDDIESLFMDHDDQMYQQKLIKPQPQQQNEPEPQEKMTPPEQSAPTNKEHKQFLNDPQV
jgi:hypothetical protein